MHHWWTGDIQMVNWNTEWMRPVLTTLSIAIEDKVIKESFCNWYIQVATKFNIFIDEHEISKWWIETNNERCQYWLLYPLQLRAKLSKSHFATGTYKLLPNSTSSLMNRRYPNGELKQIMNDASIDYFIHCNWGQSYQRVILQLVYTSCYQIQHLHWWTRDIQMVNWNK